MHIHLHNTKVCREIGCVKFSGNKFSRKKHIFLNVIYYALKQNKLPKNLSYLIYTRNSSNKAIAEHLGISQNSVSNYRTGQVEPKIDYLIKISEFFNVPLNELIYGDIENSEPENLVQEPAVSYGRVSYIRDLGASGGALGGITGSSSDIVSLPLPNAKPGSIALQVTGDSMMPLINDGDIIIGHPVTVEEISAPHIYIIVTTNDGITVKYATVQGKKLKLSAENGNAFAPTEYPLAGVRQVYRVYKRLSSV